MAFTAAMTFSPSATLVNGTPAKLIVTVTSGSTGDADFVVGANSNLIFTNPSDSDAVMPGQAVINTFAADLAGQTVAGGAAVTILQADAVFLTGQGADLLIGCGGTLDKAGTNVTITKATATIQSPVKGT